MEDEAQEELIDDVLRRLKQYFSKMTMKDSEKMDLLSELEHAEFKEAFDEFDKVRATETRPKRA